MLSRIERWWPVAVWLMTAAVMVGWLWVTAESDRRLALEEAETRTKAMADLAYEHVQYLFESADASLMVARLLYQRDYDWSRLSHDRNSWKMLRNLAESSRSTPVLAVSDSQGRFRLHTSSFPAPDMDVSSREYFTYHSSNAGDAPYTSRPVAGMVTGKMSILLSRRLNDPQGRFAGVTTASIWPDVIEAFFSVLDAGDDGVVSLLRGDGVVLSRHPRIEGALGRSLDLSSLTSVWATGKTLAARRSVSPLDGIERVISFRRLDKYGLVVAAGVPVNAVLAPWVRQTTRVAVILVAALAGLGGALFLLVRKQRREAAVLEQLRRNGADLLDAQRVAGLGSYVYDIPADRWESSAILDEIFGIGPDYARNGPGWLALVAPSMRWEMTRYLSEIQAGDHDFDHEYLIHRLDDGAERWVSGQGRIERDAHGRPRRLVGIIRDITERKLVELALRAKAEELERSNTELEQFAYVASHDLREPLRMVSSYVDLLARRYGDRLDGDALEFIAFARDGAKRMDRLVLDLLEYSRIGRITRPMMLTPLGTVLDRALKTLSVKIAEAGAEVILPPSPMPSVMGDADELTRLFQNLIGNAVKYRDPERPLVVRVSAEREDAFWRISVADNGIGIDPKFFDRIFLIFHRLHRRDEYEGTGIGLSICKKIAERHGGRISVESTPGDGSVFHVTLPAGID